MVEAVSSVFLFIGSNGYLKSRAINKIEASVSDRSSRDLDYKVLYGGETDATEILGYANTPPFSSSRRIVIVKALEKMSKDDKSRLASYAEKPFRTTCLILDSKDDSILKEYGKLARYANVKRFDELEDRELSSWARQILAQEDKIIEEGALSDLRELKGRNLESLSQELDKLIAFVGDRREITENDVEDLVGESVEASSFDLGWAVARKDITSAIEITSGLLTSGRRHQEIIGILCWHLKMLARAKALVAKGESDYHISGILGIRRKYSEELTRHAREITLRQLKSKIDILLEADLDIKRTRLDADTMLELAVIRLCLD